MNTLPIISLFRGQPRPLPLPITVMERHPLIALHRVSDFLIVDRIGEGNNCDEIELDGQLGLTAAACASARQP